MTSRAAVDDGGHTGTGGTLKSPGPEPFMTEVERRKDVTIVRPCGELDVATAATLHATLDGIERAERLVLDLRGLSFIDSAGVHLMVALDQRAQREGFQLTLVAPAAPVDQVIRLCGLDEALRFVDVVDAVQSQPAGP